MKMVLMMIGMMVIMIVIIVIILIMMMKITYSSNFLSKYSSIFSPPATCLSCSPLPPLTPLQAQMTTRFVCGTYRRTRPLPASLAAPPPSPACTSAPALLSLPLHASTEASACGARHQALRSPHLRATTKPPPAAWRGRVTRRWWRRRRVMAASACGRLPRGCGAPCCSAPRRRPSLASRCHPTRSF